jgi:hypothetical protein
VRAAVTGGRGGSQETCLSPPTFRSTGAPRTCSGSAALSAGPASAPTPGCGTFNSVREDGGLLAAVASGVLSTVGFAANWVRVAQLVEIVRYAAFPVMGYVLAILYVAFPFVLAGSCWRAASCPAGSAGS